jgi:hypothetical protein
MTRYICRPVWLITYLALWLPPLVVSFTLESLWWYMLAMAPIAALIIFSSPWPSPVKGVSLACDCPRHAAEDTDPENPDEAF